MTVAESSIQVGPQDVAAALDRVLERASRRHAQIQNIVLASPQGLVIAHRSRVGRRGMALSALAPLLDDAGATAFTELSLAPLNEVVLLGPKGALYQVKGKGSNYFVLLSAAGEANLGLLRMIASEIEKEASEILQHLLG